MPFSASHPAGVAVIGAGNIARRYVTGMARFPQLRLVGVFDVVKDLARALADEAQVTAYGTVEELLRDPAVDVVVNITPPTAHADVTVAALDAGRHVYVEKPIAATFDDSQRMLAAAAASNRLLGAAPDTFLGSAAQTARAAIDAGLIGEPVGAVAFVSHSKAESWHPDPSFLFAPGGGPALDLGPYYVTSLVNMLGPVRDVTGRTRIGAATRTVTAPGRRVDRIEVSTPTHMGAVLTFDSGVIATVQMSFDVWDSHLPFLEVYGTEGTLALPDPNEFDGPVRLRRHDSDDWVILDPVIPAAAEPGAPEQFRRGLGVADLVGAVSGEPHRASARLAQHVLEVLEAVQRSSDSSSVIRLTTSVDRPAPTTTNSRKA